MPEDFEILLCTGGPAVRLVGSLDNYGVPDNVRMQVQDWFQPWTDFKPAAGSDSQVEDVLLTYARSFYFGEGGLTREASGRQTPETPGRANAEISDSKPESAGYRQFCGQRRAFHRLWQRQIAVPAGKERSRPATEALHC